jgi:hypothetical protein
VRHAEQPSAKQGGKERSFHQGPKDGNHHRSDSVIGRHDPSLGRVRHEREENAVACERIGPVVSWLPTLFTGAGAALVAGVFNELKALRRGMSNLIERVAHIEGKMEK